MNRCGKRETESFYGQLFGYLGNYALVHFGYSCEVDAEEGDVVNVLAIGVKAANRLFTAGEEMRI